MKRITVSLLFWLSLGLAIFVIIIFVLKIVEISGENDFSYKNKYFESTFEQLEDYCSEDYKNIDFVTIKVSNLHVYDSNVCDSSVTKEKLDLLHPAPNITEGCDLCFWIEYQGNIKMTTLNNNSFGFEGFFADMTIRKVEDAPNTAFITLENIKVHYADKENKGRIYIAGGTAITPNLKMVSGYTSPKYDLYYSDNTRILNFLFENKEFLIGFVAAVFALGGATFFYKKEKKNRLKRPLL